MRKCADLVHVDLNMKRKLHSTEFNENQSCKDKNHRRLNSERQTANKSLNCSVWFALFCLFCFALRCFVSFWFASRCVTSICFKLLVVGLLYVAFRCLGLRCIALRRVALLSTSCSVLFCTIVLFCRVCEMSRTKISQIRPTYVRYSQRVWRVITILGWSMMSCSRFVTRCTKYF